MPCWLLRSPRGFTSRCSPRPPARQDDASVLNRSIGPEPGTVDPQLARTTQGHKVIRDLFEGLVSYSPSGDIAAGVAERWEVSDDGLLYMFWLRDDARWSNGDAVTADDFVYSYRRLVDPETAAFYAEHLTPCGQRR